MTMIEEIFGQRPTPELIREKYREILHGEDTDMRTMSEPTARMTKMYGEALELDTETRLLLIIIVQHYRLTLIVDSLADIHAARPPRVMLDNLKEDKEKS